MKRSRHHYVQIIGLLVVALWAAHASAAEPVNIALIPIEVEHGKPDDAQALMSALHRAIAASPSLEERVRVEMTLDEARMSFSCFNESAACMAQIGSIFDAERLVWGRLTRSDQTWTLHLRGVEVTTGKALIDEKLTAPRDPALLAAPAVRLIVGGEAAIPRRVIIRTSPSGAQVTINGEPRGVTPLSAELAPGEYRLELAMEGRETVRLPLAVHPGHEPIDLHRPLEVSAQSTRAPIDGRLGDSSPAESSERTGFWLGVGAGTVAIIAAGAAVASEFELDDIKTEGIAVDGTDRRRSKELNDQFDQLSTVRWVAWGVAGVAAGTSAYFFLLHRSDQAEITVAPALGGAVIGGRF